MTLETNQKKGFTLIEIFITLSVIVVVFAISFYYYNDYVGDAKIAVRKSNEKLVNEAISRYYKEHMTYPKYDWKKDSIEDLDKKINRGLDTALSGYFVNKKVSDVLLESNDNNVYDVFYLVYEPLRKGLSENVDVSTVTETWMLAKNMRVETKDYFVKKIRIAETN